MKTGVPEIRRSAGQETLILLLALAAFVAAVAPALRETGTPPGWDQSIHLRDSLVYERILRHPAALAGGVLGNILHGSEEFPLLTPSGYYPPLAPGITALLYQVAGRSYETAMATQILFLFLLVFGTWALGNRLLGSPIGLAAGLMLMAAPGIRLTCSIFPWRRWWSCRRGPSWPARDSPGGAAAWRSVCSRAREC